MNEFYKNQISKLNLLKTYKNLLIPQLIFDGLFDDLEKLINKQNLNYYIDLNKIPISKSLKLLIKRLNLPKTEVISNGDDYQILFTANKQIIIIKIISKKLSIKITKIGEILPSSQKSAIIDKNGDFIRLKNKGYIHQF